MPAPRGFANVLTSFSQPAPGLSRTASVAQAIFENTQQGLTTAGTAAGNFTSRQPDYFTPLPNTAVPGSFDLDVGGYIPPGLPMTNNPYDNSNPLTGGAGNVNPISVADVGKTAQNLCLMFPQLCQVVTGAVGGAIGNVITGAIGKTGDNRGASYNTMSGCPTGWIPNADGSCKQAGAAGMVNRMLPGGHTGLGWTSVLGIWGAGIAPIAVASMTRRCPKGHVLGNDGVCYRRGQVTKTNRAWNPGTKPLLTGGDVAALTKAKRLQKTIGRIASKHGKPKKSCGCKVVRGKAVKT